ncbi:orotidine-5'-phosphate decarboxylase [Halobacillus fulvus]|nr:orotidine-5'-phosphate decarboxylase [Halobacillus fulvus]
MKKLEPVYFALDFEDGETALQFLKEHGLHGIPVKVGMELFYREGPSIVKQLKEQGHNIFLDLKLHDIPETVRRAMRNLAHLGVDVVNVHAQGGTEMMKAARKGLEEASGDARPLLLAVTVLTSMDRRVLEKELRLDRSVADAVSHYGDLAIESGVDGVVCSVEEAGLIKRKEKLLALTPGIRLSDGDRHDQKRVATPEVASDQGSDSIVVGRAIRDAKHPKATYLHIKEAFENELHHS